MSIPPKFNLFRCPHPWPNPRHRQRNNKQNQLQNVQYRQKVCLDRSVETSTITPMEIRPALPKDAIQICEIWNAIIRDTLITFTTNEKTAVEIEHALNKQHLYFVAVEGSKVLGFTTYGPFRAGPGYAQTMELSLNLATTARGKGVGTQLLQMLEQTAQNRGVTALIAGVSGANPSAIRFHEKNNYTRVATLPQVGQKFGQRLDLVLLQKLL